MNDTQAMLTAKRDEMATALTRASFERKEAEQREREARKAYDEACVEYGRAIMPNGFWKGDKVKRNKVKRGSWNGYGRGVNPDKTVTERGVVTLCEGHTYYRNHWPKPGEWFVLSASGQTAYSLFDKDGVTTWTKDA
ncbi:hypothetical protein P9A28_gp34 [Sphingomonas phage Eidolon]|uniref:Uncharacterized protein n=1 Tax=Sphingomonas phage Eidolon TaxID=2686311 RepID=A0A6M3T8B2_9CAUD|nr:hypothetical protein P9A28_gp34 [Sphingomonas phage Eidolon]QJD54420.1 hypothetical protein [Sphingomonas phage Eidolon]